MKKECKVPSMISTKDLDYLSDMFNWHYNFYKIACNVYENIEDEDLSKLVLKVQKMGYKWLNNVLDIIGKEHHGK